MYYPYFRGKQFELTLLREIAGFLADNRFVPVIEPVKLNLSTLTRCMEELLARNVKPILIINPQVGELANKHNLVQSKLLDSKLFKKDAYILGYIVNASSDITRTRAIIDRYSSYQFSIIHDGFTDGRSLSGLLNNYNNINSNVFIDGSSSKMYQRHFVRDNVLRVMIRDGFVSKKNADYQTQEHFSDLHVTYTEESMNGFGDFSIVGKEYSETGGPAYAVAIHLTYIDSGRDNDMFIYHFKSDRTDSPTDPAGKFMEALTKLVREENKAKTLIYHSAACEEFIELYRKEHFPGLGYIKKLSMQHHLELVANYLLSI